MIFVFFVLPESKGKTRNDIEKNFSKKYYADGTLAATIEKGIISVSAVKYQITKVTIPRPQLFHKYDKNGNHRIENGRGVAVLSLQPIDSEVEEEDGFLVPTP